MNRDNFSNVKPTLFICYGISDCGKDTVADMLNKISGIKNIKFTECWKRAFEEWLCIPKGSLDDKLFRVKNVFNTVTGMEENYTYNDIMYRWYHQMEVVIPGSWMYAGYLLNKLKTCDTSICITDLRKPIEIDVINQLKDKYNIVLLNIQGRGTAKSTDNNLNIDTLNNKYMFRINNSKDTTLDELFNRVKDIINKINEYER